MAREARELDETDFKPTIDEFLAHNYFGDGSFFVLSAPGHTAGHLAALAHVTNGPATFVVLAGDCAHHPGVFRPSPCLPLPAQIDLISRDRRQRYSGAKIASLCPPAASWGPTFPSDRRGAHVFRYASDGSNNCNASVFRRKSRCAGLHRTRQCLA